MIVKILRKSKTFTAVRYNTNKVEKEKGELIRSSGFGSLEGLSEIRPQDYINYFSALASRNSRVVYPQFHAVISAKERTVGKNELAILAEDWLKGMGYGNQPYLLIFHKDTANNHVHMVSSRVDREGKKISDKYENIRSYKVLNKLIGHDEKRSAEKMLVKALAYSFSTPAQFMMLLEQKGYLLNLEDGTYKISKFGKKLVSVALKDIDEKIKLRTRDEERLSQLKGIFLKYRDCIDPCIFPLRSELPGGGHGKVTRYSSALCEKLKGHFGLDFMFHFKGDKYPYGYTVIDHHHRHVFKGGEIMALKDFIQVGAALKPEASLNDTFLETNDQLFSFMPHETMLLSADQYSAFEFEGNHEDTDFFVPDLSIDISDDIDDEQILGRNRRRQKKARTNTR